MWFIKSFRQRLPNYLPKREERIELARRLHDGPAQQLVALGYKLDEVIGSPDLSPAHRMLIRRARLDLIEVTRGLRDELYLLEQISLDEAVAEVRKILSNSDVEAVLPNKRLEPKVESTLAQILLELARNAQKHAVSKKFWILHSIEEGFSVFRIGNAGRVDLDVKERSLGMRLISEQIRLIGATIELDTSADVFEYTIRLG